MPDARPPSSAGDGPRVRRLNDGGFRATFAGPPVSAPSGSRPAFDIAPYVAAIPDADIEGHGPLGAVVGLWRMPPGRYEHVLVGTATPGVVLALVLDLADGVVHGHHLLDLRPNPEQVGRRRSFRTKGS